MIKALSMLVIKYFNMLIKDLKSLTSITCLDAKPITHDLSIIYLFW